MRALTFGLPVAAFVMTTPPYEWPTSTIGPEMVASTLDRYAESFRPPRRGFAGAITVYPWFCRLRVTLSQLETSDQPPCTKTIVGLGPPDGGPPFAAPAVRSGNARSRMSNPSVPNNP